MPIDEAKETKLAHEAFLLSQKKSFAYWNCWLLLKPQPMMDTKFGEHRPKPVPAVCVNPALRLGTSGPQQQHSREQQATPPPHRQQQQQHQSTQLQQLQQPSQQQPNPPPHRQQQQQHQSTQLQQLQQPSQQQPNPPPHHQQMQQQQSPHEQRSHQQHFDHSPVRSFQLQNDQDSSVAITEAESDPFDADDYVGLCDHGHTDIPGLDQFFDSIDRTLSTVGRGGSAMNTTTSSKDDAATAPGYESCPSNGHHGVIDGVRTSSSSHDEANTQTPAPDIGDPGNLIGVKRFKKIKSVELESKKVKEQLQSLFDFQKKAISEAIAAGIASFSTHFRPLLSVFAQLDGRFGNISHSLPENEQTATPAIKPLMKDVDFSGMVLN